MVDRYLTRPAIEFYDLQEDPWELNNLASDPTQAGRIAIMRAALEAWMIQQGDRGALMDIRNR